MTWYVVLPAAWFGVALVLGLLIGRCIGVQDDGDTAVLVSSGPSPASAATSSEADSPRSGSPTADAPTADHRAPSFASVG